MLLFTFLYLSKLTVGEQKMISSFSLKRVSLDRIYNHLLDSKKTGEPNSSHYPTTINSGNPRDFYESFRSKIEEESKN